MVDIQISKEEIEDMIADEFYEEEITEKQSQEALNDLNLGDYSAYIENAGDHVFVRVEFDFAGFSVSKAITVDGVTVVD